MKQRERLKTEKFSRSVRASFRSDVRGHGAFLKLLTHSDEARGDLFALLRKTGISGHRFD